MQVFFQLALFYDLTTVNLDPQKQKNLPPDLTHILTHSLTHILCLPSLRWPINNSDLLAIHTEL